MEWFLYKQLFLPLSFFPPDQTRSKVKRHQAHLKKMCGQNSPPFLFYVKTLQMSNTPFYIQQRRLLPSALHPSFFCSYRVCAERALLYSIVSANMKFSQNCSYLTLLRLLLLLRLKGGSHVFCFLLRKNICYNAKKSTPSKRTANGLLTIKPCCFSYNSIECLADSN